MAVEMVYLAVATLLAPVLAEYAQLRKKAAKAFEYVAAGGIFFLIAAAFTQVNLDMIAQGLSQTVALIAGVIGLLAVLVGGIMAVIELVK